MPSRIRGSSALESVMRHVFQTREGPGRQSAATDSHLLHLFQTLCAEDEEVAAVLHPMMRHVGTLSPGMRDEAATLHERISALQVGEVAPVLIAAHNTLLCFVKYPRTPGLPPLPDGSLALLCFDLDIPTAPSMGHISTRDIGGAGVASAVGASLQGPRQV
ncbi:hypothetical protein KIPB_009688 [Kipferlia bialata]|uniref:Uncharacterized protein n=1 Tax=Kipferlia bialata TaxID=797122 RepID=A0A9K3GKY9_9EUKA|nr:hypothetical protein KIPB_009688 [Kipferlia bialata]|eukprot:g9688.t1